MKVGPAGFALIAREEGFVGHPYFDSAGGVWTRGFGETEGIGPHSPTITEAQGLQNLRRIFEQRYEWAIRGLGVDLNQNQWDSLASTVWNLGAGIIGPGTQLGGLLRERNFAGYAAALLGFDHAGGVVIPDLRRRRQNEAALFLRRVTDPLDVLLGPERRLVDTYDAYIAHAHPHKHGLQVTRDEMVVCRKLIWLAAVRGSDGHGGRLRPGWGIHDRAARYELLLSRTRGLG